MCVHCLTMSLALILGYFMLLLCMLCRIFAPSDISEGGGFSNGEIASSEVDEDMEGRREEDDISAMRGKIAGGYPIQCQEDILESAVNLENSRQALSNLIACGGLTQCSGSRRFIECHLRDEFIDMHPEIPIRSIQADQDQQNGEAHHQAERPFQTSLDNNMLRNRVQVTDDTSSSGSGVAEVTELNVPGTESGYTPMHSHSPFDGGTEISEPVQGDYQGATGGAPNTDEFVRSIRRGTLCIVCKKNTVEVKFETCGHAVCCFECASDMQQCKVCQKMILWKTSFFI